MVLPARLLPHTVTWRRAGAGSDGYGDAAKDWSAPTDTTIRGYLQPAARREDTVGRDAQIGDWLFLTNELGIGGSDRLLWDGKTFEVIGPPGVYSTPRGAHHAELTVRVVEG